ncbi:MAG: type IV pilus secretin PilQ [Bdellovibrionota bacterium]
MGVLGKALRSSVLIAVVGCAANQSVMNQDNLEQTAANGVQADGATLNASTIPPASDAQSVQTTSLLDRDDAGLGMSVERGNGFSRYIVDLGKDGASGDPVFDVTMVNNPARLVVDVLGESGRRNRELNVSDDEFLKSVRLGAHKDRTRLVFDVRQNVAPESMEHEVDTQNGKLIVTFHNAGVQPTLAQATAPVQTASAEQPAAPAEEAPVTAVVEPKLSDETVVAEAPKTEEVAAAPVEAAPVEVAKVETEKAEPVAAAAVGDVTVESLKFEKTNNDPGHVVIAMTNEAPYEIRKTAPSEYVLTIGGAKADPMTEYPQIAPKGFPGIRSARVSQNMNSTQVRMFVDNGIDLTATPKGNSIVVSAEPSLVAKNADARAQLEAGDQPQGAKPADVAAPAGDDAKARENPTGLRSSDGSKIYTGRLISLDLQDTDIDNALRIIAEVSNLNIIASDDVTGKVTLRLIDVPWDQALDVILKTNGLDQVTEGNVIRIAPIDKLRQEREALREADKAKELLEKLSVNYIRVSYARAAELKEQVEAVLSERGTVSVDERTNQLIIKDTQLGHKQADELLKKLDLRTPQVLLETQIIESSRNILRDLGFQWNFSYAQSPATGNATGLNFPNSVVVGGANGVGAAANLVSFPAAISANEGTAISAVLDSADGSRSLSATITALEQERKVRVISRPQVATVNNKQAEISSVETLRVRTPSSGTAISTGSGASSSSGASTAFEEIKVGIELTVTPQASPDYFVLLDVNAKSSTLGSNEVDGIPSTLDRAATSTVLVKSGQTFALGGIYRLEDSDSVPGVPFLKDMPFLGHFFRRSLIDKQDEELIFFITPHIVEGSFDPSLM